MKALNRGPRGRSIGLCAMAFALAAGAGSPAFAGASLTDPVPAVRASVGQQGQKPQFGVDDPSISSDGNLVAFAVYDSVIFPDPTEAAPRGGGGSASIALRNMQSGQVSLISSGEYVGKTFYLPFYQAAISGDGSTIWFAAGDFLAGFFIFVHDVNGGTQLAITGLDGAPLNDTSFNIRSSFDGRYIVFDSYASNLVPNDTNGASDVFRFDRQTGGVTLVSAAAPVLEAGAPVPGNGFSHGASISFDGDLVVFTSSATDLVPGDVGGYQDVFVRRISDGTTRRLSQGPMGEEADGPSYEGVIAGEGSWVVLLSGATNLSKDPAPDSSSFLRLVRHELFTGVSTYLDPQLPPPLSFFDLFEVNISDDGTIVSFIADYGFAPPSAARRVPAASSHEPRRRNDPALRGESGYASDLFVLNISQETLARASSTRTGDPAFPYDYSLSGNGRALAWESSEAVLASDTNDDEDVYVSYPCGQPASASDPVDQVVFEGSPAVFAVRLSDPLPPSPPVRGGAQVGSGWYRDGAPVVDNERITGAASPVLVINPALPQDQGDYLYVIFSACGDKFSGAPASLTVDPRTCKGDADMNGIVNFADITNVILNFRNICNALPQ